MSDNLPEINIKRNKEKRGGFLGWLRGLGNSGSSGGSIAGSASTGSAGFGGALGAGAGGGFGASSAGIGALLAGKLGTILTIAAVAVAGGTYLVHNSPDTAVPNGALSSNKVASAEYVPAIVRSQAANQGSSLAMFTATNKGSGLSLQEAAPGSKKAEAAKAASAAAADATAAGEAKDEAAAGQAQGMAEQVTGGLQGGMGASSLTTSIGGGSGKFTSLGKFGQGAIGPKVGLSASPGTGFQSMPQFQERKGKLLAMKGASRPVFSGGKSGKPAKFNDGSKSWNQARALNATQRSYTGSKVDQAAATQTSAWEGTTASGDAGAGLAEGDGGAGIMTSPSLDNASGGTGTGDTGTNGAATFNDPCPSGDYAACAEDISPWKALAAKCQMMIMAAALLSLVGAVLVNMRSTPYIGAILYALGLAICAIAAAMAVMAIVYAVMLGTQFKQAWMATIYGIGGAIALAGAVGAMMGSFKASLTNILWIAGAACVCSMIGSMLGG